MADVVHTDEQAAGGPTLASQPVPSRARARLATALALCGLTAFAFAIHGYHYGIEDEAIYLSAIKKILDPALYPRNSEFFMGQARGTVLPWLIADITRVTHVKLPWVIVAAQFVSIYMFLLSCWMIAARCFSSMRERWAGVACVSALLTLPVAGTRIYLADQHLHPRSVASTFVLIAVALSLERRALLCVAACVAAALFHPLIALYGVAFIAAVWLPLERWSRWRPEVWQRGFASATARSNVIGILLFVAFPFLARPTTAWRAALATRSYYTLRNWAWYEWLGLLAPMIVLSCLARVCDGQDLPVAAKLLRRLNLYAAIMCTVTLLVALPRATDFLWPLQPSRYLHEVYVLMVLFAGALLARKRLWLSVAATAVLGSVMCAVQLVQFGPLNGTPHIDLPGRDSENAYVQAFLWARDHTPADAYFALEPRYMEHSADYSFRALAERSQMADISKDAAAVTVSPQLATEWKRQVDALSGWNHFTPADLARLRRDFGVEWVIVSATYFPPAGLDCPFVALGHLSAGAAVCRTPG